MDGNNLLESLWVEKYRPNSLEDVVLEESQKEFLKRKLEQGEIPHLGFFGPAGSGKTTTARIICDEIIKSDMDILFMNGSDQTGVDSMRNDVSGFLKSPPYSSKHKIVFIDEADYLTQNAQAILRHIYEKYSEIGRFIMTANYPSKIIDALHSRMQTFEMKTISEEFALEFCEKILQNEKVEYDIETVKLVIQNLLPDVRKVVNTLQRGVIDGVLKGIDANSIISIERALIGHVCLICDCIGTSQQDQTINSTMPEINKLISKGELDYLPMYEQLYNSNIPLWAKISVNKYCNSHTSCAVPSMHFITMIWEIIKNGINFCEMFGEKKI